MASSHDRLLILIVQSGSSAGFRKLSFVVCCLGDPVLYVSISAAAQLPAVLANRYAQHEQRAASRKQATRTRVSGRVGRHFFLGQRDLLFLVLGRILALMDPGQVEQTQHSRTQRGCLASGSP